MIGAQKCYSIRLAFDAIARTGIAEYKLASHLAQSWLKPVAALLQNVRREEKDDPLSAASVFYPQRLVLLDSVVVFSYYLEISIHFIAPPATEASEVLMANGINTMAISLSSL